MNEPDEERRIQHSKHEPLDEDTRNEQSTDTFFAVLFVFIAIILLTIFFNMPLDGLSKMLVLVVVLALVLFGVALLNRRRSLQKLLPSRESTTDEEEFEGEDQADDEEDPFKQLVREALDAIPTEFQDRMDNLVVLVEDEPDAETLARVGIAKGSILLGLYQGVPLTAIGHYRSLIPERITIYRRTIETYCHHDPERIREQIHKTVLHEVAHHFGMDHEEMPIWIK